METFKKLKKSKFITEDQDLKLYSSQFLNDSPKIRKRQVNAKNEIHDYLDEVKPTRVKMEKISEDIDCCWESRQRTFNLINRQHQARKKINDDFLKDITESISNIEADYIQLKDNAQKMEHMASCFIKRMQQISAKQKENLKAFEDIFTTFKKKAEGLILRGAIKPDDRPLWFDVYKAFPPTAEPKFARPKPENQTIKPILYKEDVIRAKFHAKGHGLSVNMLSLTGETQTRKLIQKYQQLQSEGVAEEELLQKSVEAVGSARQATETTKMTPKNPDSVTAKVLAEADLKNIFKE